MVGRVELPSTPKLKIKFSPGVSQPFAMEIAPVSHMIENPVSVTWMCREIDSRVAEKGRAPCRKSENLLRHDRHLNSTFNNVEGVVRRRRAVRVGKELREVNEFVFDDFLTYTS